MSSELQCYRTGCGEIYLPDENTADSCKYHPGAPIFHDALKGWSCCDKKSPDFSIFLDMPGCTYGFHSNEKPPPGPKVASKPLTDEEVIRGPPPKPIHRSERPPITEPMTVLKSTIGATLKQALEKRLANLSMEQNKASNSSPDGDVLVGTACKNKSCRVHYEGPQTNEQDCLHHSGVPIFHEGMKYWSCCQKKTTEFDKFLDQIGCESGKHNWVAAKEQQAACRMDWYQTGNNVIISVFAKCADPTKTIVKVNQVSANIVIVFEDDNLYSESFELNGVIDVKQSSVKMLGAKVEINLRKASPVSWGKLQYQAQE